MPYKCPKCGTRYGRKGACVRCKTTLERECRFCQSSKDFCTCEVGSTKETKPH